MASCKVLRRRVELERGVSVEGEIVGVMILSDGLDQCSCEGMVFLWNTIRLLLVSQGMQVEVFKTVFIVMILETRKYLSKDPIFEKSG